MLVLLTLHLVLAMLAPLLVRWCGRRAFYLLALAPAAAFGWAVARTGTVRDGGAVVETYRWVPQLHLDLALRVSTLSWLMVLLVGGVGALVLVYGARYFAADEPGLGRFAGTFVSFAGAMFGLVVADNLLLLYVFWELTTVCSYLLIGHHPDQWASRRAAAQALVVTGVGGLAMLVGLIMLGQHAGTYRVSALAAAPLPAGGYLGTALVLILIGALTKSAIFPVSFWLPAAMVAPTPVSAYLHAAAMVKAGVYLVALLAPLFAADPPWRLIIFVGGAVTMLSGGWAALRQTDLKLLLAYGTVSQLGLLLMLTGAGTRDAALAGTAMLLAHALFKSALFLVVGIVDHGTGTRELPALSGLWRRMPLVCAFAVLAAASMAGVPPLLGFVAKEAVFEAFDDRPVLLVILVTGTALTVAYSLRFLWGAFADKQGQPPTSTHPVAASMLAPVGLLALAGVALGVLAGGVDHLLSPYAERFGQTDYHLTLWHGPGPALGLAVLVLASGGLLFALRDRVAGVVARLPAPVDGATVYQRLTHWLDRLAIKVTGATQRGSLPQYLGTILVVLVVVPGGAMLFGRPWPDRIVLWHSPVQLVIGVVLATAAVLTVRARRRLTAILLVGVTGYGTAMLFILHGAPDLALTQFLVETVSIVMFVLVLRRLPANFSARPLRRSRWLRVAVGVAVGLVMSGLALVAAGGRQAVPISVDFAELAVSYRHGRNIVNVTLVDIRAWDTIGEIAVLVVAATGVASLIFERPRAGPGPRRPDVRRRGQSRPERRRERVWLRAGPTQRDRPRSLVFEVVTRLIFHTIVLFSIFLLLSGHNAPGGGFSGGLVVGLALAVRYFAGGRYELDEAAPVDAGMVLGAGLLISIGTGVMPLLLGRDVLRSAVLDLSLPVIGELHLITSVFFEAGVYLIVVGLVLDILRSLGAELDRQIEIGIGPETELEPLRERELR
jgi:multicomponent Na+:H+ antiporter subunit A